MRAAQMSRRFTTNVKLLNWLFSLKETYLGSVFNSINSMLVGTPRRGKEEQKHLKRGGNVYVFAHERKLAGGLLGADPD